MNTKDENYASCSFCGKNHNEVKKLVAGPNRIYICNECIEICCEILKSEATEHEVEENEKLSDDELIKTSFQRIKLIKKHISTFERFIKKMAKKYNVDLD